MTTKSRTCPVCEQPLPDPSAVARVAKNLDKLAAKREDEFQRQLETELRRAERTAEAKARKQYEAKLKSVEEAAATKARTEERRRQDRLQDQLMRQNDELRRKLERLTADEKGEIGEADIRRALQEAFPTDIIERIGKSRGSADIRHEVREQGRTCGVIIYEVKNVAKWSTDYLKQVRKSLVLHHGTQAVLVSTAFPAGKKYLTFEKDVAVVHPTIVASVVRALRQVIVVRGAATAGTQAERSRKADKLLQFVKSEEYRRGMKAVAESMAELMRLQAKERQQHDRVWAAQSDLYRAVEQGHAAVDSRVAQIVSGVPLSLVQDEEDADETVAG